MYFKFAKMHGLGNDFIVIDLDAFKLKLTAENIIAISNRHTGIGADQVLTLKKADENNLYFYSIYNANGSEVGQCGNGARCVAKYIYMFCNVDKNSDIYLVTKTTKLRASWTNTGDIAVEMGHPIFNPDEIPFKAKQKLQEYLLNNPSNSETYTFSALSLGNPHAIIQVTDIAAVDVDNIGKLFNMHSAFPEGVNVSFMQVIDKHNFAIRVFERGVGETKACGSGACAAHVAGSMLGLIEGNVNAHLHGGKLTMCGGQKEVPLIMSGPASYIYEGTYNPN